MWQYNNLDELYHYGVLGMRWGRRRAKAQALITSRKQKATNKAIRVITKKPNSTKANKLMIKATKTNVSRYGQTNGRILTEGVLKNLRNSLIGGTAAGVASRRGKSKLSGSIMSATLVANTYQGVKTGYKLVTNYKPRKN